MRVVQTEHTVAAAVRARRQALGMSQAALAERAGVSRWWVATFEGGRGRVELGIVLRVVDLLDLDLVLVPRNVGAPRPGDTGSGGT